jgi:hypothetical protein
VYDTGGSFVLSQPGLCGMTTHIRSYVLGAAVLSCFLDGAWAQDQYRTPGAQRCAVIDCNAPNRRGRDPDAAAAAAAAQAAADQQRRDAEAAAEEARQRQEEADADDRRGLQAAYNRDWTTAAAAFIEALELEPDDQAIRAHLDRARIGAADSQSAADIGQLNARIDDALAAADIDALRERFHIEALQMAIPPACLVARRLQASAICDVIRYTGVGWHAADANGQIEMLKILASAVARQTVFMSFGTLPLRGQIGLVDAMQKIQARAFERLEKQIRTAMLDDQKAAKLRTRFAIADASAVAALRALAVAEGRRSADTHLRYLASHPNAPGITVHCEGACRQLVEASQGVGAFH